MWKSKSHTFCVVFYLTQNNVYHRVQKCKYQTEGFINLLGAKLTGNNVLVAVLLDVILFFCCLGGVGLVSAVLRGLAFQPLKNTREI